MNSPRLKVDKETTNKHLKGKTLTYLNIRRMEKSLSIKKWGLKNIPLCFLSLCNFNNVLGPWSKELRCLSTYALPHLGTFLQCILRNAGTNRKNVIILKIFILSNK